MPPSDNTLFVARLRSTQTLRASQTVGTLGETAVVMMLSPTLLLMTMMLSVVMVVASLEMLLSRCRWYCS